MIEWHLEVLQMLLDHRPARLHHILRPTETTEFYVSYPRTSKATRFPQVPPASPKVPPATISRLPSS